MDRVLVMDDRFPALAGASIQADGLEGRTMSESKRRAYPDPSYATIWQSSSGAPAIQ